MKKRARGNTLIEVVAVVATLAVLGPPLLIPSAGRPTELARQQKDQRQIGELMAGMNSFAHDHQGWYPLPGQLDLANTTVSGGPSPERKNNTGNMLSVLIFNGYVRPQQMVSPAESATGSVIVDSFYEYRNPRYALQPARALWDPGFAGTPHDTGTPRRTNGASHQSYAQLVHFGARRAKWRNSFNASTPILANRGPTYATNDSAPHPATDVWTLVSGPLGVFSNTLLIHGPRNTWEGHIGFNDGHVQYTVTPNPSNLRYQRMGPPLFVSDNIFVNESDEVNGDAPVQVVRGRNVYMRPIANVTSSGSNVFITAWRD